MPLRLDSSSVGNSSGYKDTFWGNRVKFRSFLYSLPKQNSNSSSACFEMNHLFFLLCDKRLNETKIYLQLMQCLLFIWHGYAFSWQINKWLTWKCILAFCLFQTKFCLSDRLDAYLILADLFGIGVHGYFSQQSQNVNTESVWFKYLYENKNAKPGFSARYFASYLCIEQLFWHTKFRVSNPICHPGNGNTIEK